MFELLPRYLVTYQRLPPVCQAAKREGQDRDKTTVQYQASQALDKPQGVGVLCNSALARWRLGILHITYMSRRIHTQDLCAEQ